MKRIEFIKSVALLPLIGGLSKLNAMNSLLSEKDSFDPMPVLFVGHGSPTNAIEDNEFSRSWADLAKKLPLPKAILCVSAHWETQGTYVTAMDKPKTIHDFGGFQQELYDVQYPAPGSPWLAGETQKTITSDPVGSDQSWGLDHGCWSVLCRMYPNADVPIIQLSLDSSKSPKYHYDIAKELSALRSKGVMIVSSGNMVHNLGMMKVKSWNNINEEFGFDWAYEANSLFKKYINEHDHKKLINYHSLGTAVQKAIPTNEHYLPLLYSLALQSDKDEISYFNDKAVAGSLTMTSLIIGYK